MSKICVSCGAILEEEAAFCDECGVRQPSQQNIGQDSKIFQIEGESKVNNVETSTVLFTDAHVTKTGHTEQRNKKKSFKLPVIIGVVVFLAILAALGSPRAEDTDDPVVAESDRVGSKSRESLVIDNDDLAYVDVLETVKTYALFGSNYAFSATCGNVFDKYISSAEWGVSESGDTGYVNISGTIKGTAKKVRIVFGVMADPDEAGHASVMPISAQIGDAELGSEEDIVDFLYFMFEAYEEGYNDVSELADLVEFINREGRVELSETYSNEIEGIQFKYPNAWEMVEADTTNIITDFNWNVITVMTNDVQNTQQFSASILVMKVENSSELIEQLFVSDQEYMEIFGDEGDEVIDTSIVDIDGISGRVVEYIEYGEDDDFYRTYLYGIDSDLYMIFFRCLNSQAKLYKPVFDAIMDSYSITIPEGSGFWGNDEYYESPYPDGMNYALEEVMKSEIAGHYGGVWGQSDGEINIYAEPGENWEYGYVSLYLDSEIPVYGGLNIEGELMGLDMNLYYIYNPDMDESILLGIDRDDYGVSMELYIDNAYVETYFMLEHYE